MLDGFTDIVYIVDIMIQFRTGYLEQGLIVYDDKKLARHYTKDRCFMLDLLAIFPLDFFQIPVSFYKLPFLICVFTYYLDIFDFYPTFSVLSLPSHSQKNSYKI